MPSPVHVVATFAVRADAVDSFVEIAQRLLVRPAQDEAGCLRYELCQAEDDPARLAMIECWDSSAALDAHLARPELGAALDELRPLVTDMPTVTRYRATA